MAVSKELENLSFLFNTLGATGLGPIADATSLLSLSLSLSLMDKEAPSASVPSSMLARVAKLASALSAGAAAVRGSINPGGTNVQAMALHAKTQHKTHY